MNARRLSVTATTDATGAATVYIPSAAAVAAGAPPLNGRVLTLIYTKIDFAAGVDFAITAEASGEALWSETDCNASKTVAPRQPTHSTAGAASLYAAAGEPVEDHIVLAEDRIKIVVAQGGDTLTGTFTAIVG
jgi:hypothetical protein